MDYPKFIVSDQKEETISIERVKAVHIFGINWLWVKRLISVLFYLSDHQLYAMDTLKIESITTMQLPI